MSKLRNIPNIFFLLIDSDREIHLEENCKELFQVSCSSGEEGGVEISFSEVKREGESSEFSEVSEPIRSGSARNFFKYQSL